MPSISFERKRKKNLKLMIFFKLILIPYMIDIFKNKLSLINIQDYLLIFFGLFTMEGRLIIVGTGLQLGQLTLEAKNAIEHAKKVLYLISDPITESYIHDLNKTAESMIRFYADGKERLITYNEIIDYTLKTLEEYKDICVAYYGHPGVFTYPSHKAIEKAREKGYEAKMLPGISTEDMIFCDLGFDPGTNGLQSFEATQLLKKDVKYDSRCCVVIWQIGVVGIRNYSKKPAINENLIQLRDKLLHVYPKDHKIYLYLASTHRMFDSTIITTDLQNIVKTEFDPISTLVIPPFLENQ